MVFVALQDLLLISPDEVDVVAVQGHCFGLGCEEVANLAQNAKRRALELIQEVVKGLDVFSLFGILVLGLF